MGFVMFADFVKSFGFPMLINVFLYAAPVAIAAAVFYILVVKE